jgi:hypothetical protein
VCRDGHEGKSATKKAVIHLEITILSRCPCFEDVHGGYMVKQLENMPRL